MAHRIQFRRDTKARWLAVNPVLQEGEVGFETDTHCAKVGDGVHQYSALEYSVGVPLTNISQTPGTSTTLVPSLACLDEVRKRMGGDETAQGFNISVDPYLEKRFSRAINGDNFIEAMNTWLNNQHGKETQQSSVRHGWVTLNIEGILHSCFISPLSYANDSWYQIIIGAVTITNGGASISDSVGTLKIIGRTCTNGVWGNWTQMC